MATDLEETVLENLTDLTIEVPIPEFAQEVDEASNLSIGSKNSPHTTEIRNIAYHVNPPTVPSTRSTPLINELKRTDPFQFGSRRLEESDDVFAWNAWDHVDPSKDELFMSYSASQYAMQREHAASEFDRRRFNADPEKWWNKFYGNNEANFFKDRKWLRQEFPVLNEATTAPVQEANDNGQVHSQVGERRWNVILEVGAGAGNTAFPIIKQNQNPALMIHACDFSSRAVQIIQNSEHFDPKHLIASQWDMAAPTLPPGLAPGSADIVLMIFAFSALAPGQWVQAVKNIWDVLRPGGEVCFRDYGRGDLAQVRFRKGRLLGENFYVRGDGTRVYFFEEAEIRGIWGGKADNVAREAEQVPKEQEGVAQEAIQEDPRNEVNGEKSTNPSLRLSSPAFEVISLATDRRLLVNRQKQLKMYRCWQQGRFRKPVSSKGPPEVNPSSSHAEATHQEANQ